MTSVWFVVPAHGRVDLSAVCLRQLARTCETLAEAGVAASAVVIADDENLEVARELGFATVERENRPLGRKWNDGYELAGRAGVDFVIPFGSDDWIDPAWVLAQLDAHGELRCSRQSAVVDEDGAFLSRLWIEYPGRIDFGDGVRMIPTGLLEPLGFRPAEEDRPRAIDTSVFQRVAAMLGRQPRVSFTEVHPLQIVDFKSERRNLNSFYGCKRFAAGPSIEPWAALEEFYPAAALEEMRGVYGLDRVAA